MDISKISPGNKEKVNVLIECTKGSKEFYKYDKNRRVFFLKEILRNEFPGCYGFIPRTHHIDAEPLDVLVLTTEPLKQGILLEARPIGLIRLRARIPDEILIAVPIADKNFETVKDLDALDKKTLGEIEEFLESFKNLEVENVFNAEHAKRAVERAIELYVRRFG
jgi:inorganic pyrophosphatase